MKDRARVIIDNLTPLVGCKYNEKEWSPRSSYVVCRGLNIASLVCLNANNDKVLKRGYTLKFDNRVTLKTVNIYKLVKSYSPIIISQSYVMNLQNRRSGLSALKDLLQAQSLNPDNNDSAIVDILDSNKDMTINRYYQNVLLIVLDAYSIRHSLFEYAIEDKGLKRTEINTKRIERLCDNILYTKAKLEEVDAKKYCELNHHLSTLLHSIIAIKRDILAYYLEV